jgi:hypothetical protein
MRYFPAMLLLVAPIALSAQAIRLSNPSFEDTPRDATVPQGWLPCQSGTTPDILPGYWGVYTAASDGETYVGLITRPNGTWESIGQRLTAPLLKNVCYSLSLDLAHADTYAGYAGAIRLRVWGGDLKCVKRQLLWESPVIDNTDWKTFAIRFVPKQDFRYILLEAFYQEDPFSFAGNILIDGISVIRPCDKT